MTIQLGSNVVQLGSNVQLRNNVQLLGASLQLGSKATMEATIQVGSTVDVLGLALVSLNVHLLVNLLCPDAAKQYRLQTAHIRAMHDFAINSLNKFGWCESNLVWFIVNFDLLLAHNVVVK